MPTPTYRDSAGIKSSTDLHPPPPPPAPAPASSPHSHSRIHSSNNGNSNSILSDGPSMHSSPRHHYAPFSNSHTHQPYSHSQGDIDSVSVNGSTFFDYYSEHDPNRTIRTNASRENASRWGQSPANRHDYERRGNHPTHPHHHHGSHIDREVPPSAQSRKSSYDITTRRFSTESEGPTPHMGTVGRDRYSAVESAPVYHKMKRNDVVMAGHEAPMAFSKEGPENFVRTGGLADRMAGTIHSLTVVRTFREMTTQTTEDDMSMDSNWNGVRIIAAAPPSSSRIMGTHNRVVSTPTADAMEEDDNHSRRSLATPATSPMSRPYITGPPPQLDRDNRDSRDSRDTALTQTPPPARQPQSPSFANSVQDTLLPKPVATDAVAAMRTVESTPQPLSILQHDKVEKVHLGDRYQRQQQHVAQVVNALTSSKLQPPLILPSTGQMSRIDPVRHPSSMTVQSESSSNLLPSTPVTPAEVPKEVKTDSWSTEPHPTTSWTVAVEKKGPAVDWSTGMVSEFPANDKPKEMPVTEPWDKRGRPEFEQGGAAIKSAYKGTNKQTEDPWHIGRTDTGRGRERDRGSTGWEHSEPTNQEQRAIAGQRSVQRDQSAGPSRQQNQHLGNNKYVARSMSVSSTSSSSTNSSKSVSRASSRQPAHLQHQQSPRLVQSGQQFEQRVGLPERKPMTSAERFEQSSRPSSSLQHQGNSKSTGYGYNNSMPEQGVSYDNSSSTGNNDPGGRGAGMQGRYNKQPFQQSQLQRQFAGNNNSSYQQQQPYYQQHQQQSSYQSNHYPLSRQPQRGSYTYNTSNRTLGNAPMNPAAAVWLEAAASASSGGLGSTHGSSNVVTVSVPDGSKYSVTTAAVLAQTQEPNKSTRASEYSHSSRSSSPNLNSPPPGYRSLPGNTTIEEIGVNSRAASETGSGSDADVGTPTSRTVPLTKSFKEETHPSTDAGRTDALLSSKGSEKAAAATPAPSNGASVTTSGVLATSGSKGPTLATADNFFDFIKASSGVGLKNLKKNSNDDITSKGQSIKNDLGSAEDDSTKDGTDSTESRMEATDPATEGDDDVAIDPVTEGDDDVADVSAMEDKMEPVDIAAVVQQDIATVIAVKVEEGITGAETEDRNNEGLKEDEDATLKKEAVLLPISPESVPNDTATSGTMSGEIDL